MDSDSDPVTCRYCDQPIVCDPQLRSPSSAWTAPDADDPTACLTAAPGHAPATTTTWVMRPSQ